MLNPIINNTILWGCFFFLPPIYGNHRGCLVLGVQPVPSRCYLDSDMTGQSNTDKFHSLDRKSLLCRFGSQNHVSKLSWNSATSPDWERQGPPMCLILFMSSDLWQGPPHMILICLGCVKHGWTTKHFFSLRVLIAFRRFRPLEMYLWHFVTWSSQLWVS